MFTTIFTKILGEKFLASDIAKRPRYFANVCLDLNRIVKKSFRFSCFAT